LREVTAATQLPVFAIGGIDAARIKSCREAGAYGVAVLGAAWAAADVRQAVSALVQSVEEASSP
jgi:thiamine-phosphate pyrophosphorylase